MEKFAFRDFIWPVLPSSVTDGIHDPKTALFFPNFLYIFPNIIKKYLSILKCKGTGSFPKSEVKHWFSLKEHHSFLCKQWRPWLRAAFCARPTLFSKFPLKRTNFQANYLSQNNRYLWHNLCTWWSESSLWEREAVGGNRLPTQCLAGLIKQIRYSF